MQMQKRDSPRHKQSTLASTFLRSASRKKVHRRKRSKQDRPAIPCTAYTGSIQGDKGDRVCSLTPRGFCILRIHGTIRSPKKKNNNNYF